MAVTLYPLFTRSAEFSYLKFFLNLLKGVFYTQQVTVLNLRNPLSYDPHPSLFFCSCDDNPFAKCSSLQRISSIWHSSLAMRDMTPSPSLPSSSASPSRHSSSSGKQSYSSSALLRQVTAPRHRFTLLLTPAGAPAYMSLYLRGIILEGHQQRNQNSVKTKTAQWDWYG